MTVLVTGGAGYIGSHMVRALLEAGDQVVVLDNLTTGFDWAVPPGATLIVGDAGDQSRVGALIAAHRIDAIIHFAASIVVPDSVRDPLSYYQNNTVNSRA
jgi:UDP-glucose 4-epimerase